MDTEQARLVQWLSDQHEHGIVFVEPLGMSWPMWAIYRGGRVLFGELRPGGDPENDSERTEMYNELQRAGNEVRIWRSAEIARRDVLNWLWTHFRIWWGGTKDEFDDCKARKPDWPLP
jgi:hypothetical protein